MDGSRKRRTPSEINIRRAVNGGLIVRHSFDNSGSGESYMPSEEHAFADHGSMLKHVRQHTGPAKGWPSGGYGGGDHGAGRPKAASAAPRLSGVGLKTGGRPTGTAGKAKAAPPTRRTKGAGVD